VRDEELRALERAAKKGDRTAALRLVDVRARAVTAHALDLFVCGRVADLTPATMSTEEERSFERRSVFFIANVVASLSEQGDRRRVLTWAASVHFGPLTALAVMTHGLAVIGITKGEDFAWREGRAYVHYSPRREPSWGFCRSAWGEIPARRPSAAEARAALEAWALARSEDRVVVTGPVAAEWSVFASDRYQQGDDGDVLDLEREDEDEGPYLGAEADDCMCEFGVLDLEREDEDEGPYLGAEADDCMCEFGDCGGTRYLQCRGCGGDLCICICGGDGGECLGCEDCRRDRELEGEGPYSDEDGFAEDCAPFPDPPERATGGPS
jgi:hypothetical protein